MKQIIPSHDFKFNSYSSVRSQTTKFSQIDISTARQISLKKSAKHLFMLIGKMLEIYGSCLASRQKLSYMLSEKIHKTLCPKQISRLTGILVSLKLLSKSQTIKKGQNSYNTYNLTELGWCLFYLYNFRIEKIEKCPTVKSKNVPPLITKSINKDILIPTSYLNTEIYRETKPTNIKKEVVNDIDKILDEKLRAIPSEIAKNVREQTSKYISTAKIISPLGFINHLLSRETQRYKSKFEKDYEAQKKFREQAKKEIERTSAFINIEARKPDKERLSFIMNECKRRLYAQEDRPDI